ncbi:MAG: tRNA (guanosine(37)-N1)-methyltransferase TrmD [Thiotrichaceae bacterium]|nr:tRNA (guanosine(37)-N1)-methyltransferase TrmD [Thiotrichaceae bacterium]
MRFDVITLLPELVNAVVESGVISRAQKQNIIELICTNPRDFAMDKHRTVDDRPYGGGPGMVMKAGVLLATIREVKKKAAKGSPVIYLSPQGKPIKQAMLQELSTKQGAVLLCGRYEGIDERLIDLVIDEEWSLGDYVLSGGELGAMIIIDAVTRLLPNALGHKESALQDSFSDELLDCPHYTRPETVEGLAIPKVLASGNHQKIAQWRRAQALGRTYQRRPDLLEQTELSEQDKQLLKDFLRQP